MTMPAMLLAAGLGTRLVPITDSIPKCLVPIHGKPLLGYWFDLLGGAGLSPLIVNTHHFAETVRDFVAGSPWHGRVELTHEDALLGTGGTLLANRERFGTGSFMVIHADNLSRFNVQDFMAAHRNRPPHCVMTMMLFRTDAPETCGIVELDDAGAVRAFHEKKRGPYGNLANAAVYIMEPEVMDMLPGVNTPTPDISLHLIPKCLGKIYTWQNNDYHRDIGTPASYRACLAEFDGTSRIISYRKGIFP